MTSPMQSNQKTPNGGRFLTITLKINLTTPNGGRQFQMKSNLTPPNGGRQVQKTPNGGRFITNILKTKQITPYGDRSLQTTPTGTNTKVEPRMMNMIVPRGGRLPPIGNHIHLRTRKNTLTPMGNTEDLSIGDIRSQRVTNPLNDNLVNRQASINRGEGKGNHFRTPPANNDHHAQFHMGGADPISTAANAKKFIVKVCLLLY